MMDEAQVTNQVRQKMEQIAEQRARERARTAMWDLDVALFFFSISLLVIILVIQGVGMEFVAPSAICGLAMGWLIGRLKGKKAYKRCYDEELLRLLKEPEEIGGRAVWQRLKAEVMKELGESSDS